MVADVSLSSSSPTTHVILILILLCSSHFTLVSPQLYTYLEDLAENFELRLMNSDHSAWNSCRDTDKNRKFNCDGIFDPKNTPDKLKYITCLAKMLYSWDDPVLPTLESWDYFRNQGGSNMNPLYFCANMPNPRTHYMDNPKDRPLHISTDIGIRSPHSLFWLQEPTAWLWWMRWSPTGFQRGHAFKFSKTPNGILFVVDVTGIKNKGRFLKGWFHLKIRLDIDHNFINSVIKMTADEHLRRLVIDKLMVTARGRTLVPGRPFNGKNRVARRAWVGGIGEFVKDFPRCANTSYNTEYVTQQFMTCGTVQYAESVHGNNFYYTRTVDNAKTKYGQTQVNKDGKTEIHLNFKLDNSLCNKYYDLDFVVNGMVINTEGFDYKKFQDWSSARTEPGRLPQDKVIIVQRSVSTRFVFASSHAMHHPTFYENADPIPRGVPSVDCSEPLQGEWVMNNESFTPPTDPIKKMKRHRLAVSYGADLILNTDKNATADSTFGGAIKFIYDAPTTDELRTLPEPNYNSSDYQTANDPIRAKFGSRRTWTHPDHPIQFDRPGLSWEERARSKEGDAEISGWVRWADHYEFPREGLKVNHFVEYQEKGHYYTAVQRILNEFDWETWREDAKEGITKGHPRPEWNATNRCNVHSDHRDTVYGLKSWPHPYYDITCVGLQAQRQKINHPNPPPPAMLALQPIIKGGNPVKEQHNIATEFQKTLPPITGRCLPTLFYNDGAGSVDNGPPKCDEFFQEWWNESLLDPALGRIVQTVDIQQKQNSRKDWVQKYAHHKSTVNDLLCSVVDKLKHEFGPCPRLVPRPYTKRPDGYYLTEEGKEYLKWLKKEKEIFLASNSYKRGMLAAEDPFTLYIWDSRLLHGIFMTIITMFVTPISFFMSRYFKETFMNGRIFLHHIWFFVHISASFVTVLLFLVGMWRIAESTGILGVSLSTPAKAHRVMGWISITISALLLIFGGIRVMVRPYRALIILAHGILGVVFYLMCLACMLTANAIPGSPAAYNDFSVKMFSPNGEAVFIAVSFWILFEIGMHTAMTILQIQSDRIMSLTSPRLFFFSPMPVLEEKERFDAPGRFARIYMLTAYILVALSNTILICCFMVLYSPRGKGLGFMSCTHSGKENDVEESYHC